MVCCQIESISVYAINSCVRVVSYHRTSVVLFLSGCHCKLLMFLHWKRWGGGNAWGKGVPVDCWLCRWKKKEGGSVLCGMARHKWTLCLKVMVKILSHFRYSQKGINMNHVLGIFLYKTQHHVQRFVCLRHVLSCCHHVSVLCSTRFWEVLGSHCQDLFDNNHLKAVLHRDASCASCRSW